MHHPTVTLTDLYAPIRDDLTSVARLFDRELATDIDCVRELCERIRAYRGKMLRPALLLLTGRACGSQADAHITLGAVVEMVHMATLVHDDVLDEADERRRQPTVCATDGNVTAVLLGDYLISHAFHLCSSLKDQHASRRIGATTNMVCEGELLQNHRRGTVGLSESEYFDIVRRKTGALTACCCELGAYYAGADQAAVARMYDFGMAAGVAFQIIDDVLDIVGERNVVGKTLAIDLALGKLTLPTIHCLAHADPEIVRSLGCAVRGEMTGSPETVRTWLADTGSVDYAVQTAATYVCEALQCLQVLPPGEARSTLETMTEFIIDRRF